MTLQTQDSAPHSKFQTILKPAFWLGIFLLTYNNLINFLPRTLHAQLYIWMNIGILFIIWMWSRQYLNLSHVDVGYTKQNLGKSLLLGFGLTLMIILPFFIIVKLLPILGLNLKAPQLDEITRQTIWWRIFVRIPLGTVLFEETLFRGILYGFLMRKGSAAKAVWVTSLFFTLWHITPAFKVVTSNFQIGAVIFGLVIWVVLLLGALLGGLLFAWIRYRTRNIAGCILAHFLINILALMIMYWIWI